MAKKKLLSIETKKIPYFDGLPAKGASLTYLSQDEASNSLNCNFDESLWIENNEEKFLKVRKNDLDNDGVISGIEKKSLTNGINTIIKGKANELIAIAKMDDIVGHGVFAINDIPAHTVLCIYSGEIKPRRSLSLPTMNDMVFYTGNFKVEASSKRGIASFMQHLPADTRPLGDSANNIATTNVMPEFLLLNNIPVIAIVTLRKIKAFEQIGFSYGEYWVNDTPKIFNLQGEVIEHRFSNDQIKNSYGFHRESCCTEPDFIFDIEPKEEIFEFNRLLTFQCYKPKPLGVVRIVDSKRSILSEFHTDNMELKQLRSIIGAPQIQKYKNSEIFEIQQEWLIEVSKHNPSGITELARLFKMDEFLFRYEAEIPSKSSDDEKKERISNQKSFR